MPTGFYSQDFIPKNLMVILNVEQTGLILFLENCEKRREPRTWSFCYMFIAIPANVALCGGHNCCCGACVKGQAESLLSSCMSLCYSLEFLEVLLSPLPDGPVELPQCKAPLEH